LGGRQRGFHECKKWKYNVEWKAMAAICSELRAGLICGPSTITLF